MEIFNTICTVCIIVGFAIPLIDLFFGLFNGIDVDLGADTDMDIGIGFSFMSLMLGIAVFGIVGKFLTGDLFLPLVILIAFLAGILVYFLVFWFVYKPLKANRNKVLADNMEDLVGKPAEVILTITDDNFGTVKTTDSTGASIKYMAGAFDDELDRHNGRIPKGTQVAIVDVDEKRKLCIVKMLDF